MTSCCLRMLSASKSLDIPSTLSLRLIHTSLTRSLDQRWRAQRGLPMNQNAYGVLTDTPDYTFLDGRATPYGSRQRKRMETQRELAEKIIQYTKEIDFAKNLHENMRLAKEEEKQRIIRSKLKPKGNLLLTSKNKDN